MTRTCGLGEVGVGEEGRGGLGGLEGARTKGLAIPVGFSLDPARPECRESDLGTQQD